MAKHTTIWKSYGMYDLKEMEQAEQDAREFLEEEYSEDYPNGVDDSRVTDEVYDRIDMEFEDEESNLYKQLDGRILAIASMGLWNGRKSGYKILGNNLNEVLTSSIGCDEKEVYCDAYNVYAEGYHHDGRNHVEFREIREDRNIENLLDKIYSGKEVTRREMNYYTRSLRPYIKSIYGI
jgi:hypothetical protein